MTADPAGQVACRRCGSLLNRYLDLATGNARYIHPARQPADHEPDPAPADQVDTVYACDFCSDEHVVYAFRTGRPIKTVLIAADGELVQDYGTDWSACLDCADLVHARDLDRLHARVTRGQPFDPPVADRLHEMLAAVLGSLLPGRAIAGIGRWPATPLQAATLPKVRDRLTHLIRGTDDLPVDHNHAARAQLATSLDVARLYWIDPEFTDLTLHAAATLPSTPFTAADLPAPQGLIAWAHPVGDRDDLIAASWTSSPGGVRIVGYRSIGAGLPPATLQRLREQVGWLVPRHTITLQPGQTVDAASPAGSLVATWLLIGQKLAETTAATVDKAIRKAYQRTGRPAPDVRLVRIRPTAYASEPAGNRHANAEAGREHEYRWWVRGHWRNQAFGPGRAQRRLIYLDPQIRGPRGKPIKASTVVRILGTTRPPRSGDGSESRAANS